MEIINKADLVTPYVVGCDCNAGCSCKASYTNTCTCYIGSNCGDKTTEGCFIRWK